MSEVCGRRNRSGQSASGQSQLQTKLNFYVRFGRYRPLHIPGVMPAQAGIWGGGGGGEGGGFPASSGVAGDPSLRWGDVAGWARSSDFAACSTVRFWPKQDESGLFKGGGGGARFSCLWLAERR